MCRNSSVLSCVCHRPAAQPSELSAGGALPIMHGGEFTTTPAPAASRQIPSLNEHILDLGCRCGWEGNAVAYHVVGGVLQGLKDEYSRDINI
jgi:hypothetical protein